MTYLLTILFSVLLNFITIELDHNKTVINATVSIIECSDELPGNLIKPELPEKNLVQVHKNETRQIATQKAHVEYNVTDPNVVADPVVIETKPEDVINDGLEEAVEIVKPTIQKADHSQFDNILKRFVNDRGVVDYRGLKNAEADLDRYLDYLKSNPAASLSRDERLAFWINAYNAFTLKLIVSNYPVASITDLDGGKPWDKTWINIGDKSYSLNQIENKIIRPEFNDARIHFAVNCAAKSCPPLANTAFTALNLESLLERRTRAFINNPSFTKISAKGISVSKIFEWYAEDFGILRDYIAKYYDGGLPKANIGYLEYDWTLNGR